MIATIFLNGEQINRIVADEDFTRSYCEDNGYTYTMEEEPEPEPTPEPEPDTNARLAALEAETAAISAAIERGLSL